MNPAFLDSMSWEMAEVYGAISDQILINLARHFPFYEYVSDVPTSAFAYQSSMLAQMGQISKETIQIIRNNLSDADLALQNVLEQAIIDTVRTTEPQLLEAAKKGVLTPMTMPVVSPNQYRAFQLYYKQAADKLNLVNTVMLESTKSAYQQTVTDVVAQIELAERLNRTQMALDTAAGETITGVSSWNQALIHATDKLKQGGITGFIDHAGRQWSAEAYTAMDIRTTVFNTSRAAVWETNETFGNDLYQVSYHDGARPLCYPWQGKVISANNNARTVQDLDGNEITVYAQSDTSYGEAAGLFGINCKHYPTPFIPGVSLVRSEPQTEEENAKTYEESQKQRGLERKIREEKRDLMMLKAQGAPDDMISAQREKVKQTSQDIDDFCNETGRARRRNREGVYTKREFPDADKYNVAEFETKQKNIINNYYYFSGGEQKNYRFGELKTSEPITKPKSIKTVQEYNDEIAKLREKRSILMNADEYNKAETDKMLSEIFDLEDKRSALIASQRPDNEPEFLKQFKRYDPASRTDREKLAQVNPKYYTNGSLAWKHNCQRTVATQEMIYRGYDVTARPYNRNDAIGSSGVKVWDIRKDFWNDPEVSVSPTRSSLISTITDALQSWGDGSRGIIRVQWTKKYGGNGHFLFARNVNGTIEITDPQNGKVVDIGEKVKKTTTARNQMWIMRVDNRNVNDNISLAMQNAGE